MGDMTLLAQAVRRQYFRDYRLKKAKNDAVDGSRQASSPTANRDRRYWLNKADKLIDQLQQNGRADIAEKLLNCPSAVELAKILNDLTV